MTVMEHVPQFTWRSSGLYNKVPEVTVYFWIIKVLATTVGESCADWLNQNLGLGLANTTYIMSGVFVFFWLIQFFCVRYVPAIYWLNIVLISTTGTLITDNLTDNVGLAGWICCVIFGCLLLLSFAVWYGFERTLSIHSIFTRRREFFYWLVVLFTFALGTAAGDLISEKLGLGYWEAFLLFAGIIAAITILHYVCKMNAVFSFWAAYIMTRPLGASLGDLLAQPKADGGLGLGPGITSAIFLAIILVVVVFLSVTKKDVIPLPDEKPQPSSASEATTGTVEPV